MITFLFSPFIFLAFVVPSVLIGILVGFWRYRNTTKDKNRRAKMSALIAAAVVFVEFSFYVGSLILASERSTAILGLVEIPLSGIPLALFAFVIAWAVSFILERGRKKSLKLLAIVLLAFALLFVLVQTKSTQLITQAKTSQNAEELAHLSTHTLARYDVRIPEAIARNANASVDLLNTLAEDTRGRIRQGVARNPSTPPETLRSLYAQNGPLYSDGYFLYDLAANPNVPLDILVELSEDENDTVRNNAATNPSLPADILCELSKESQESNQYSVVRSTAISSIRERGIQCSQ